MSILKKKKKSDKTFASLKSNFSAIKKTKAKVIDNDDDDEIEDEDDSTPSLFLKHIERLKVLEDAGVSGEAYDIEVLKSLRWLVLDLIPIADENYRKFPIHTAASALNQYINQEREILNDIRGLEDFQGRADRIATVFKEECETLTKSMISKVQAVQTQINEKGTKNSDKYFEELLRQLGMDIKTARNTATDKIMALMTSSDKKK